MPAKALAALVRTGGKGLAVASWRDSDIRWREVRLEGDGRVRGPREKTDDSDCADHEGSRKAEGAQKASAGAPGARVVRAADAGRHGFTGVRGVRCRPHSDTSPPRPT